MSSQRLPGDDTNGGDRTRRPRPGGRPDQDDSTLVDSSYTALALIHGDRFRSSKEFVRFLDSCQEPHEIMARLRQRYGFTQAYVAKRAGVHISTVSRVETGEHPNPRRETLLEILAVYYLTAFEKSLVLMRYGYKPENEDKWLFDRNARGNQEIDSESEGPGRQEKNGEGR